MSNIGRTYRILKRRHNRAAARRQARQTTTTNTTSPTPGPDNTSDFYLVVALMCALVIVAAIGYVVVCVSNGLYRCNFNTAGFRLARIGHWFAVRVYLINQYQRLQCETLQPGSTTD